MKPIKVILWSDYLKNHPNLTGCLINQDNNIYWFQNGLWHREDGPALEFADGNKVWYKNGVRHREDGPAVECSDGYRVWWVNGIRYATEQEWLVAMRKIKLEKVLKQIHT